MALDLSGAAVAPPRSARGGSRGTPVKITTKKEERREAVQGVWQLAGFGCVILRQYADAGAIGLHSEPITNELVDLADKNDRVAKALDYLTEAGPYAGLIVAVMPLALQVLTNHGLIRGELVAGGGVVPPAALESQVRADMARQATAALQAQQEAEAELARLAAKLPEDGSPGLPEANGEAPHPVESARKTRRQPA
jgi:hypothetical protein